MKISIFTLIFFLLFVVIFTHINNAATTNEAVQTAQNPVTYGWVGNAQLSDLSPTRNRAPYDLLLQQRLEVAVPGLERELAKHPESLAAYVGLMQAEPAQWPAEIKQLRAKTAKLHSHQEAKSVDLFKLGTLLYYQWGQQPPPPRDQQAVTEAQTLLAHAWQQNHQPIIGLMFGEMLNVGRFSSDPLVKGWDVQAINQQLVKELAGPTAYSEYIHAKQAVWREEPPEVSLVPTQNLRPLLAIVASLRSVAGGRTGTLKMIDGKPTMVDFPVPDSQLAEERFFKEWFDRLVIAVKAAG